MGSFVLFAAFGCHRSDADIIGSWQGDRDWKKIETTSEPAAKALAAVNLEIKVSGRFLIQDGGVPFEGNWVREGDSVRFDVDTVMNRNLDSQPQMVKDSAMFSVRVDPKGLRYKSKQDTDEIPMIRVENKKN